MAKKRKKVPLRKHLSRLHKKADKAISLYVREITAAIYGGKCPFCKERPIEACFHFIRRGRKILRWDLRNLIGSCHADNWREYRNPDPYRSWLIRNRSVDLYLKLVDESEQFFDPSPEYLQGIIDLFTQRLAELKAARKPLND